MDEIDRRKEQLENVNELLGSVESLLNSTKTELGLSKPRSETEGIALDEWQQRVADLIRDPIGQISPDQITALQRYLELQRDYLQGVIIKMGGSIE